MPIPSSPRAARCLPIRRRGPALVAEDQGAHPDTEPDLVAYDVGIDGGAASAEEAAVHVQDEDDGGACR